MATDSIMARPTNKVRVMVAAASGCCARELNAVATARPSPRAGPTLPSAIVRPAVTIEATAMSVMLSMESPVDVGLHASSLCNRTTPGRALARGGRDVDRGQDAENIGLHHAGEQPEGTHENRENEGRDGEQNGDDHRPAHHVAEQADRQGQGAGEFTDDVERQHDDSRFNVG